MNIGDIVEMKFTASSAGYSDTHYWRKATVVEVDGWKYVLDCEGVLYARDLWDIREIEGL